MKTARKTFLMGLCVLLLIAGSVLGTLAYFTDSDAAANTFTVGSVKITLDEKDTDNDENTDDNETVNGEKRDLANEYHLVPGGTYDKDPTVHVQAGSTDCYLFVTVKNGLADIEKAEVSVATQMNTLGWKPLMQEGVQVQRDGASVYYYQNVVTKSDAVQDFPVFETFTIDGDKAVPAGEGDNENTFDLDDYKTANITVTGFAIQAPGFDTVEEAWAAMIAQLS